MNPRIRRAGPDEDWATIRTLVTAEFTFMEGRIDPPSSIRRWTPEVFAQEAAEGLALLAEDGDTLIGCVFCREKGEALYLGKLAVRADRRGAGLARALVDAAEVEARRRGLKALTLQTRIELTENHAAFAAMGFVRTGATAHEGYDRPTSLSFARPISG